MQSLRPLSCSISSISSTTISVSVCRQQAPRCLSRRCFHDSRPAQSGHSRWSTIKHDKAKNDASKNKQRSVVAQEIATASKLFGPDPNANPRLADLITKAKRTGFAKASIESAILRGQGKSSTGAALEPVTIEGVLPGNIAVIIECETESRLRTMAGIKHAIKDAGGNSGGSCTYLFGKKGRIVLEGPGADVEHVLEAAIDVGALDVEQVDDGDAGNVHVAADGAEQPSKRVLVFTEPSDTKAAGEALSKTMGLQIAASEIFWDANEDTKVHLEDDAAAKQLAVFVDGLREIEPAVQGIYMNVAQGKVEDGPWAELMSRLDG